MDPFDYEALRPHPVVGVDEAGRGCLAGPVFAAAVILDKNADLSGITDSKLVKESKREILFERIMKENRVGVGFADVDEIEELNILNASLLAMRRAVEKLELKEGHLIVDGIFKIKGLHGFMQTPLVKGDLRAKPIAAASIIAKVSRDRYMRELAKEFPAYGFELHKGYSTAAHKAAIKAHGPIREHRKSFAGVSEFWPAHT